METAKRLTKFGVRFRGPHSPELFKSLHTGNEETHFDHTVIGTGESRAVAAARAMSHLRPLNLGHKVLADIEAHVALNMPSNPTAIEAPEEFLNIYCILSISVER
jgi:hypothetical protein